MARFVYVDETEWTRRSDGQKILTLVAAQVEEAQVRPLAELLGEVATRAFGPMSGIEFHGHEVFHRKGKWGECPVDTAVRAYREVLQLLKELDISLAYASINVTKLKQRYGDTARPYLLALQFLLEKVDGISGGELQVVVADEFHEFELRAVQMVADMQDWGSGEVPGKRLRSIIDSLHFVRSSSSPGVQLADMAAFILQRAQNGPEGHPDAARIISELDELVHDSVRTWRMTWPA